MKEIHELRKYLMDVETTKPYKGYLFSVANVMTMVVCGLLCGLQKLEEICDYCHSEPVRKMLKQEFCIMSIPSYSQLTRILAIISPESLNAIFIKWCENITNKNVSEKTIAIDGKTIKSTQTMNAYESPLHIVSAYVTELGITIGQTAVQSKSNEIPATQELIKEINISGAVVTADALNCQKETARLIIEKNGDYVLAVKKNHKELYDDIKDMFDFITTDAFEIKEKNYEYASLREKSRNRIERRECYVITDISWLESQEEWESISAIAMVKATRTIGENVSVETRYYVMSKKLTPEQVIKYTRNEWGVESMHWLLDVNFDEDNTMIFNENSQRNLNMMRKIVINLLRIYKVVTSSKKSFSSIMRNCLFNINVLVEILSTVSILSFSAIYKK